MPVYKVKNKRKYYFMCRYVAANGVKKQYHSKNYDSRREAEQAESLFKLDEKPTFSITFEEVGLEWLKHAKEKNSRSTYKVKRSFFINYYEPFYKMKIGEITALDIRRKLLDSDREIYGMKFSEHSTSTKNSVLSALGNIFKRAQIYYGLQYNPTEQIERYSSTTKEKLREMSFLSPEEFKYVYDVIKPNNELAADVMYMLFWTGMRFNECLSLTFNDFDGEFLHISKQYFEGKKGGWEPLKTKNSIRRIEINQNCIDIINKRYELYSKKEDFNKDWFIFGGYKKVTRSAIRYWRDWAVNENANIKPFRLHDLRHSYASYLISKNVPIFVISRRLGHSSIQMTLDRYGHLLKEKNNDVLSAINEG